MPIGDILSKAGVNLPEGTGASASNFFTGFIFFVVVAIIAIFVTLYFANKRQYNKKIHMFEEIAGKAVPCGDDVAREIILPNTSIRALFLKGRKLYLPRPSIQTGKGHYWYFIRKDGEWINVGIENLNSKLDELKIHYDHTDMRMANASLKKLIEKNYKKLNWLKEFAPYIAMGILILILAISAFLVINQANKTMSALGNSAEINKEVSVALGNILVGMDNVCSYSGIRTSGEEG